jgi:hypothetical protein
MTLAVKDRREIHLVDSLSVRLSAKYTLSAPRYFL